MPSLQGQMFPRGNIAIVINRFSDLLSHPVSSYKKSLILRALPVSLLSEHRGREISSSNHFYPEAAGACSAAFLFAALRLSGVA
jgi:hypothetical protein